MQRKIRLAQIMLTRSNRQQRSTYRRKALCYSRRGIRIYCPYEKEPYEVTARCGDQVHIRPSKAWSTDEMSNMLNDLWLQTEPQEPQPPAGPVAVLREHTSGQEITPSLETGVTASPVTDHNPVQKQPLPRGPGRATRRPKRRSNFDQVVFSKVLHLL